MPATHEDDPLVQAALKDGWTVVQEKGSNPAKFYYQNKALKQTTRDLKKDLEAGKFPMPKGAPSGGKTPADGGKTPGGKTPAAPSPAPPAQTPAPAAASLPAVDGKVYYRELHDLTQNAYQNPSAAPSQEGNRNGIVEMNNALHIQLERVRQEKALLKQAIEEADARSTELKNSLSGAIASENISADEEQVILMRHERDENRQRQNQLTKLMDIIARGLHEPGAPAYEAAQAGQRTGTDAEGAAMVTRFLDSSARHALSPQSILNVTRYRDSLIQGQQSNMGSAPAGNQYTWFENAPAGGLQTMQYQQPDMFTAQPGSQQEAPGPNTLGLANVFSAYGGNDGKQAAPTPGGQHFDGFVVRNS